MYLLAVLHKYLPERSDILLFTPEALQYHGTDADHGYVGNDRGIQIGPAFLNKPQELFLIEEILFYQPAPGIMDNNILVTHSNVSAQYRQCLLRIGSVPDNNNLCLN